MQAIIELCLVKNVSNLKEECAQAKVLAQCLITQDLPILFMEFAVSQVCYHRFAVKLMIKMHCLHAVLLLLMMAPIPI